MAGGRATHKHAPRGRTDLDSGIHAANSVFDFDEKNRPVLPGGFAV
jgi:hypothetical protein